MRDILRLPYLLCVKYVAFSALAAFGAEPAPRFEVTNKVPPAFTVTNRLAPAHAPGTRLITTDGRAIVLGADGVWRYAADQPDYYAAPEVRPRPFPVATTPGIPAQPAVGLSTQFPATTGTAPIRTGVGSMGRSGNTRPFSGSFGVTSNCGVLG